MLHTPLAQLSVLLVAAAAVWALAAGRWPERAVAAYLALDSLAGVLFQDRRLFHHVQPVSFGMDVGQLVLLIALVLACRRTWVLWAAALSLLLVVTHLAVLLDPSFNQWSYLTATYVWGLGFVLALAAGVALEGRRPAPSPWARVRAARPSTPSATARSRS